MYSYYYQYEAYFMFGDISLRLGEGYAAIMGLLAIAEKRTSANAANAASATNKPIMAA